MDFPPVQKLLMRTPKKTNVKKMGCQRTGFVVIFIKRKRLK